MKYIHSGLFILAVLSSALVAGKLTRRELVRLSHLADVILKRKNLPSEVSHG